MSNLPQQLHSVARWQRDDQDSAKMLGSLASVVDAGGRAVHLYTGVRIHRIGGNISGSAVVAWEPGAGEIPP